MTPTVTETPFEIIHRQKIEIMELQGDIAKLKRHLIEAREAVVSEIRSRPVYCPRCGSMQP